MSGLRELLDAATAGPWEYAIEAGDEWWFGDANQARIRPVHGEAWESVAVLGCGDESPDARLIALAPELARLAIDMADALRDATSYECWCAHTIGDVCVHCKRRALLARFDRLTTGDAQ